MSAVLSHQLEDGPKKPVAFAFRSLAPAEKYSQLDKEGLAIVFGVKHFHQYLVGHHFTTLSDHQPLQHLFGKTWGVPTPASAHIQLWERFTQVAAEEGCLDMGTRPAASI